VIAALVAGVLVAVALAVAAGSSVIVAYVLGLRLVTYLTYGYDRLQEIRAEVVACPSRRCVCCR